MKEKLVIFVLYALLSSSNCIKIVDSENATTTIGPISEIKSENTSEAQVTEESSEDVTTPTSHIHKIPPTLHNAKTTRSPKDNLPPASVHKNIQNIHDGKLKSAILHTKTQHFNKLMEKSNIKVRDQVRQEARPEAQTEASEIITAPPPTAKEFVPSPELSSLFSQDNQLQDHFHPMNQYQRFPNKHDAQFPQENFYKSNPIIDTKWLGGNRPTGHEGIKPHDVYPHYLAQHGLRNTNVEFPHVHQDRHAHYHLHHRHRQQQNSAMVFPTDSSSLNLDEVIRTVPALPTKIPGLFKHNEPRAKGTWKWIPESDEEVRYFNPDTKFTQFEYGRPLTVRDRPYSFESSDIFTHHTTPPSAPPSAEFGSEEGEVNTGRPESGEKHHDLKILKPPSPWKRILHVMTAAIPIGILISALTPRIVYVHPNATVPTAIPPLAQQQPPPPIGNIIPPNAQPSPLRQRGMLNFNNEINAFLRIMDAQFKERHRGHRMDATCEDRFFCEVALMGANRGASRMHKTLYHVALETPHDEAEKSGLSEIFTAIKRQNCNVFKCKKVQ